MVVVCAKRYPPRESYHIRENPHERLGQRPIQVSLPLLRDYAEFPCNALLVSYWGRYSTSLAILGSIDVQISDLSVRLTTKRQTAYHTHVNARVRYRNPMTNLMLPNLIQLRLSQRLVL